MSTCSGVFGSFQALFSKYAHKNTLRKKYAEKPGVIMKESQKIEVKQTYRGMRKIKGENALNFFHSRSNLKKV